MSISRFTVARVLTGAAVSGVAHSAAPAQTITLGGGVAFPRGPMAERRALGGQISLAISPTYRVSGRTVRGEVTGSWFPRRDSYAATSRGREEGTLSVGSALVYFVYMAGTHVVSPHVGVGVGVCRMKIPGRPNPYGTIPEVAALLGARIGTARVRGLIEVQDHMILSDHGNDEFEGSRFIPVRVGISVEIR